MTSKEREKAAEQTGSRLKYLNRALCLLLAAAACLLGIRLSAMRILPAGYMAAYITAMPAVWLPGRKESPYAVYGAHIRVGHMRTEFHFCQGRQA